MSEGPFKISMTGSGQYTILGPVPTGLIGVTYEEMEVEKRLCNAIYLAGHAQGMQDQKFLEKNLPAPESTI